jgi:hypothetical protein
MQKKFKKLAVQTEIVRVLKTLELAEVAGGIDARQVGPVARIESNRIGCESELGASSPTS